MLWTCFAPTGFDLEFVAGVRYMQNEKPTGYMDDIHNGLVVGIKKIPREHNLPEMKAMVFKRGYGFQAVCIELLLDGTGESESDAYKALEQAIETHTMEILNNHDDNEGYAMAYIYREVHADSDLKSAYLERWNEHASRSIKLEMLKVLEARHAAHKAVISVMVNRVSSDLGRGIPDTTKHYHTAKSRRPMIKINESVETSTRKILALV